MKYAIRDFQAPHALVEYLTDGDQHVTYLNVRIDKKADGTFPQGLELDNYILSFAPNAPGPNPYEGADWGFIQALVTPSLEIQKQKIKIQRESVLQTGVVWNNHPFPADAIFQGQIANLILAFDKGLVAADALVDVRTSDDVTLQLTQAQLLELAAVLVLYVRGAYKSSWDAQDAL